MRGEAKCVIIAGIVFLASIVFICQGFVFEKSIVHGQSMYPTLKNGETIWSLKILDQNLTGKIISYETDDRVVCHRVVENHGDYVVTKGDNNPANDPWQVEKSQISSRVLFILPFWCWFLDVGCFMGICALGVGIVWKAKE